MAKQMKDGLSRRDFLKKSAVVGGAAGLGAMGLPGVASAAEANADWMPTTWHYTTDVLVIGTGYAGQAAAIAADKAGSSVLVIEKAPFRERGGNSRVCGQGLLAPSPAIHDDYKAYLTHMTAGQGYPTTHGEGFTSEDTINFYVEQSYETRKWFADELGMPLVGANNGGGPGMWMPFYPTFPGADAIGTEDQYWTHRTKVAGAEPKAGNVWANLEKWILDNTDVKFMYKTAAKRLVQNPKTREVLGLIVTQAGREKAIKARQGVVVCAGGWEYNQEMIRDFQHIPELYSIGTPFNTGETIKMCWDAGAAPRNMGVIAAPTYWSGGIKPGFKGSINLANQTRAGAFIMVGRNNKRFFDEWRGSVAGLPSKAIADLEGTYTVSGQEIRDGAYIPRSMPEPIHMIFDEAGRRGGAMFSLFFGWGAYVEGFKGSADNSAELANGWMVQADTIRELAVKIDRDPDELQATIDKWNADCSTTPPKDTQFDTGDPTRAPYTRPANRLQPFTTGPFYAIQAHQCTLNTQGGMVRNLKSQLMSIEGPPIPRLYAAGENGDIFTILYQCMSNAGSGCLVHGRVAGAEAAALSKWDTAAARAARTTKKAAGK